MIIETIGLPQLIRELAGAADAVVKHWDTPAWKYEQHTGEVIAGLRAAIEKARQAGVTDHIADINKMVATEQSSAVAVPDGWPTDRMVVYGAEVLHDSLIAHGFAIDFDENNQGTEIQQDIAESVFAAMIEAATPKQDGV